MMRSYVCQQCRLQLHRQLPPSRYLQLQSARTIVSFRKTPITPQPEPEAQRPSEESNDERDATRQKSSAESEVPTFRITKHDNRGGPRPASQDPLSTNSYPNSRTISFNKKQTASNAQRISELLGTRTSSAVEEAWNIFKETYTSRDVPALKNPTFSDINYLMGGKVFLELLHSVGLQYIRGNAQVPTPTEVLFRYEQLGITPTNAWKKIVADMTFELLRSVSESQGHGAAGPPSARGRSAEGILAELLSIWRFFFQRYGPQDERGALELISAEWINVPENEVTFNTGRDFGLRMQQFHPSFRSSPELMFSAIAIFNQFFAETGASSAILNDLRAQNKPFLDLLTSTLAGADVSSAFKHFHGDRRIKSRLDADFTRSLADQMEAAPSLARKINGLDVSTATPEDKASHMVDFFLKRISKEVNLQSNASQLEKLWIEAETHYKTPAGIVQIPPALYNAFLRGFMILFKPDHTARVWNHMIAHNVLPDLETWLAMLVGCARAKDVPGLNQIWERMLNAGIEPDVRCWTTRVHGLISCREVKSGTLALDDMGKRWLSAENMAKNPPRKSSKNTPSNVKTVNRCAKPEIGVINGAINAIIGLPTKGKLQSRVTEGMTHKKKVEFVHRFLQWAGNFDIKPDIRTYNALISLYLDNDDHMTAFKLLRQMEKEGIEGDLSTHAMLLRAAFDNHKFDSLSQGDQAQRVIDLFSELEQNGLRPNGFLYQMAIDRLLKIYSNMVGVRVILEHMINRGYRPGASIFSSLATHYLQQNPPAIKELDSLVTRVLGPPAQPTDTYFFDRIVEGYARNDEVPSMMTALTKMSAHGKRPSFRALGDAVAAVYRSGDWERAKSIIRDVQERKGLAAAGPMTTHNISRKEFFQNIARSCPGLMDEFAGEYVESKDNSHAAASQLDYATQAVADDGPTVDLEELYNQTQESYDEYFPPDQPYEQDAYEQTQMPNQQR